MKNASQYKNMIPVCYRVITWTEQPRQLVLRGNDTALHSDDHENMT